MAPKPPTKTAVAGKAPAGKSPADKEAGKKTVSGVDKKKKRTASKRGRWETYIVKLLKQVHPDTGISKKAVSILNSFVDDMIDRLCAECSRLGAMSKRKTVNSRDVQSATQLVLPGDLANHATSDAKRAVTKALVSL